jgi:thymidylate synthase
VQDFYKPLTERRPDFQYRNNIEHILKYGRLIRDTPQGIGAYTCFGTLPKMVFDLSNGVPLITERKIGFWRKPIAEIIAFMNGARTIDEIESYGCDFWEKYRGGGTRIGLDPDDMGPGSYGPAFHDFEIPGGGTLNQFEQLVEQIKLYPEVRTHLVTPWKPYYTARGPNRKVIVAPCHGWQFFRVIDGELHLTMVQRSADMPIGVPSNMIQYAAVLLMICHVTGLKPGTYVHDCIDAHIYEDQVEKMHMLTEREPFPFPQLKLSTNAPDLFSIRAEHFELDEYSSHPGMSIPFTP